MCGVVEADSVDFRSFAAVPYLQNPHLDPQFRVYFSEEWFRALDLALRNFLSEMLNGTHILNEDSMQFIILHDSILNEV